MSDESDLDEDIDKILNDLAFDTKKEVKNEMESKMLPTNRQQSQKLEDSTAVLPERENSSKSGQRRGSFETPASPSNQSNRNQQRLPTSDKPSSPKVTRRYGAPPQQDEFKGSNLLATIFSANPTNDDNNKRPLTAETTKPSSVTKASIDTPDRIKPASLSNKDAADWLGLASSSSPLVPRKENSTDDGDDELLRTLRRTQLGSGSGENQTRQRVDKPMKMTSTAVADDKGDSSFLEKINTAKKLQPSEQIGSFEDKLPVASLFEDKFSFNASSQPTPSAKPPQKPIVPANPPPAGPDDTERKAFLQNLFGGTTSTSSVLKATNTDGGETNHDEKIATEDHVIAKSLQKKKAVVTSATGKRQQVIGGPENVLVKSVATLQVPSHLIDEDELKTMSSSLKSLYTNHLDLMDKSYSEQMAVMNQSHLRKEEMLKEEIRIIHKDYESRLERLKSQMMEAENKSLSSKHQEDNNSGNSTIIEQLKVLQNAVNSMKVDSAGPAEVSFPAEFSEEILKSVVRGVDQVVNSKLTTFEDSLHKVLEKRFAGMSNTYPDTIRSEIVKELTLQIEKSEKKRRQEIVKFGNAVVEGITNTASKLSEVQKKVGENVGRKMLDSIAHTMETQRAATAKDKDKSHNQMKELRENLRRFSQDLENRNEVVLKFHGNLEGEQKKIAQNLQDLNNWLQVHFTRNSLAMNAQTNMQALDNSLHSELEIQLLKEERKSLSEYMAEINVERRKLTEEKIAIEHERRELERDRSRVHDLEITLKMKLTDAEELRKQIETARNENYRLGGDIVRQQNEVEKDRVRQKECLRSIEENLKTQYENVLREKMDILREKEFFEKLRSQLLCPGCLKSLAIMAPGQPIMTPFGGHNTGLRTIGDGLEKPVPSTQTRASYFFQTSPIRINDDSLNKEIKYLDDLYLGYSSK